ncbi:hypothetical protein L915_00423, partial [Phytophthora nicotianae]
RDNALPLLRSAAAASIFATLDPASAAVKGVLPESAFQTLSRSLTAESNDVSTKTSTVTADDEQRAISIKSIPGLQSIKKIPGIDKLKKIPNLFKSKITPDTYFRWAKKGKTPEYVFGKIKLDKAGNKLFDNSDFNVWVAYTRMVVKDDPDRAIFTFLSGKYDKGDLMKMAGVAAKPDTADDIASKLVKMQIDEWKVKDTPIDDAFKALKLNTEKVDDLLTAPNLKTWLEYVNVANANTGTKTPMISTFRAHFEDRELLRVFKAAQASPDKKLQRMGNNLEASLVNMYRLRKTT